MTKVVVIYRMCDGVEMLHTTQQEVAYGRTGRFCGISKRRLITKCLSSVKDVMKNADSEYGIGRYSFEFICVYDNCSEEIVDWVRAFMPDGKMVPCRGEGNGDSFCTCVDIANSMVDDDTVVLFLEDDYMFLSADGLSKAVDMMETARTMNGGEYVGMFLDDYPDKYGEDHTIHGTDVMVTPFGHIVRTSSSTCSFMTYVGAVKANYERLMKFGNYPKVMESESVDLMWKKCEEGGGGIKLYSPIPAITLHCQLRSHIPMYLNADMVKKALES